MKGGEELGVNRKKKRKKKGKVASTGYVQATLPGARQRIVPSLFFPEHGLGVKGIWGLSPDPDITLYFGGVRC